MRLEVSRSQTISHLDLKQLLFQNDEGPVAPSEEVIANICGMGFERQSVLQVRELWVGTQIHRFPQKVQSNDTGELNMSPIVC